MRTTSAVRPMPSCVRLPRAHCRLPSMRNCSGPLSAVLRSRVCSARRSMAEATSLALTMAACSSASPLIVPPPCRAARACDRRIEVKSVRNRVSSRTTGRRSASSAPAAAFVADSVPASAPPAVGVALSVALSAVCGRLGVEAREVHRAGLAFERLQLLRQERREDRVRLSRHARHRGARLGLDALEGAGELERAACRKALVGVVKRRGKRHLFAEDGLRDHHLAHHVARVAPAHDDFIDPRIAQMKAQRQLGRLRRRRALARREFDLQRADAQRLDRQPPAEQRGEVRAQADLVRLDAHIVGGVDQPVRAHLARQPPAQVIERELLACLRRGPMQSRLRCPPASQRRPPRRPARLPARQRRRRATSFQKV